MRYIFINIYKIDIESEVHAHQSKSIDDDLDIN